MISNRTFGIEIECYLPVNTDRGMLAEALRAAGIRAKTEVYNHETRNHWKLTTDASLGYDRGVEVVSPVLSGIAGLQQVATVGAVLTAFGCTVNVKCGLHVHIGASDLTVTQIGKVAKNFIKFENFFDHIMPTSRRADLNQYVLSNRSVFGGYRDEPAVNAAFHKIDQLANDTPLHTVVHYISGGTRYRKLNLQPLLRYGTLEFRQHSGTVDAEKMVNWIKLLVAFVEASIVSKPRKRTAATPVTPAEELTRFFKMFQTAKEVQQFYRQRMKEFRR